MVAIHTAPITAADIHDARQRIAGVVRHTPLLPADALSERFGLNISLKLENLQRTGAFKLRGAYNKIACLSEEERARGLIAASSGNHAQGVAYAAQAFGLDRHTKIYMPQTTPQTKIDRTLRFGAVEVVLVDGAYDDASRIAHEDAYISGATFIEPYNDWEIIAGQGTIGLEIIQDAPQTDVIVVPVGGGGLLGGIALAAKSLQPHVQLYGVQCSYDHAVGATLADGIRVKHPGEKPLMLIHEHVQRLVHVHESMLADALKRLAQEDHIIAEGAAAVGLAALAAHLLQFPRGTNVVIVLSGGNIDLARWGHILTN